MTPEELLSQLKEIHEPGAIGVWPLAPGWWLLIAITIFVIILTALLWHRHIKLNGWKKEAAKAITALQKQTNSQAHHQSLFAINQLIKRIAIHQSNDRSINALTGESWHTFMNSFLNGPDTPNMFSSQQLELLSEDLYRQEINTDQSMSTDITVLLKTLNRWIKEV